MEKKKDRAKMYSLFLGKLVQYGDKRASHVLASNIKGLWGEEFSFFL